MPQRVLIAGTSPLLAARLAARCLTATDAAGTEVVLLSAVRSGPGAPAPGRRELADYVMRCGTGDGVPDASGAGRLTVVCAEPDAVAAELTARSAERVWCVVPGWDRSPARGARADAALTGSLLTALPALGARGYVHVGPDTTPDDGLAHPAYRDLERLAVEACLNAGVSWRVLRTAPVVDAGAPELGECPPGAHRLLWALHSVRAEIADRVPDWFERHPLRVAGTAGLGLPLLDAGQAADGLWRAGGTGDLPDGFAAVPRSAPVPLADVLARAGAVYGVDVCPVPDRDAFDAADRLLDLRLTDVRRQSVPLPDADAASAPASPCSSPPGGAGGGEAASAPAALSPAGQWEVFGAVRARQSSSGGVRDAGLRRRDVEVAGRPLTLFEGGSGDGPPLLVLNALGQGPGFLTRLCAHLAPHHRVVTWQVRGTERADPAWGTRHQLDDIDAVLGAVGAGHAHLLGWCTGAKIATAFQQHRPDAVASLVFLNATFRQDGRWDGMDTKYEADLAAVCRALDRRPDRAARMLDLLAPGAAGGRGSPGARDAGVLGVLSGALADEVRRPFRDAEVLVRYARQLVDLWRLDSAAQAPRVAVPALFVCSEFDGISSPARAREAARCFPRARYAELAVAGHYAPHDRPALVAELITEFVRAPHEVADLVRHAEITWHVDTEGTAR
ncbi:alpha/beta hydrolase [Streptomyces olivaceus]|uniref:alpha/beta fold hydrolase n=1 Tax=Streptomyces olivaceus TaxID=47716 RepID=UPI0021E198B2|nr:alpha/beta hydrolase [Streptomyces olivaceus]MBZ6247608.1 alpha/beta hydrolase [Streptomyces olivaceus]